MASPNPPPTPPPNPPPNPPPDAEPLSDRERDVLRRMAAAEHAADPRFGNLLAAGRVRDPEGPMPRRVAVAGAVLVVGVVAGFVASGWFLVALVLVVVASVPAVLVGWMRHQDAPGRH